MTRKSRFGKQANIVVAFIVALTLMLVFGAHLGLFSIFQATPSPGSWIRIYKIRVGDIKQKSGMFGQPIAESTIEKINYDYQILDLVGAQPARWQLRKRPTVQMERGGYYGARFTPPITPSLWNYRQGNNYVIFEFDPDEENAFAPDLIIVVKYIGSEPFGEYRPMMLIPHMDGGGGGGGGGSGGGGGPKSQRRVAKYDVHIIIASKHSSEIPNYYSRSVIELLVDSYYLIDGYYLDYQYRDTAIDDRTGLTKIEIVVPEAIPEHEPGDVWLWEYLFNLPKNVKIYEVIRQLAVVYDPSVVVTSATLTLVVYAPTHTEPATTVTTEVSEMEEYIEKVTETVVFTELQHVTTTVKETVYSTRVWTRTETQLKPVVTTETIAGKGKTRTVTIVQTVKVTPEFYQLIEELLKNKWLLLILGLIAASFVIIAIAAVINAAGRRSRGRRRGRRR